MEAPPPPPPLAVAPTNPTAAVSPDSIDSSPRSRQTDSWDADPPPPQRLRLMCSYGGHIVPRPHDKTLCYIGGDTRIIVIDRHTSLADLRSRLSKTLLHNQPFTLKYQLPNEDLDSLISVTTDEDLENMVEEYDRLNNPAAASGVAKSGRLRLFLFPKTSSNNIEQLLVETASTKSEDWFFNALNGKASTLSAGASDRGLSESSSINCLLGLDDDLVGKTAVAAKDVEAQIEGSKSGGNGNNNVSNHDVNSVPDSPMLETTSSFGSTSSTPSVANLPPIRVHVEENPKVGIEDQFQHMNLGVSGNVVPQKLEEAGGFVAAVGPVVSGVPVVVGGDYPNLNRVISDDERSEQGGYKKTQQVQPQGLPQLPIPQFQQRQPVAFDLASPDSVSSEGSMANPLQRQRQAVYQDSILQLQSGNTRVAVNQPDPNSGDQTNAKIQMQPPLVQESSGYVLHGQQYEQNHPQLHQPQQFIHAGSQYISAGPVPIASYYPMYPPQQQNHLHQPAMDQQYPFYFIQARHTPGYNIPMQQANYNELAPNAPSSRPQTPPSATPLGTFNQAVSAPSKPEMATGVYRTAMGSGPQLIQVPSSQHQPQYVGFSQIHHPSQSVAPSAAANSSYAYELTDPNHAQMYYNQALPPQVAAHYQTLTSAPAVVVPDTSGQVPSENIKQQVRNLQQ
ncbi:Octicosapeptide/Phox/Bem1p family protein [Striga hermonthica]|uniref:Octicosapeptide/Phox/Bem1p family protein n=1 Tax=Striga hermonthica TaxID=68872 RepID=A0A9N7R1V6_STRHE|nr:Octicosapeptide/Phox/Bem1p family protein [Striga hermonthica]